MAVLSMALREPAETTVEEHSDDEEAEDELRLECEEKQNEVVELQQELRAARLEAQQLRLRLQAQGAAPKGSALQMPNTSAAGAPQAAVVEDPHTAEIGKLLRWLVPYVDLAQVHTTDVGLEVEVERRAEGGVDSRPAVLGRVAQWPICPPRDEDGCPLSRQSPQLWLSVPIEHKEAMTSLLRTLRDRPGDGEELRCFASICELWAGEMTVATLARPAKAVLLATRSWSGSGSQRSEGLGALIAPWPSPQALEAFRALHATEGEMPVAGDRVEVQYEGAFYAGDLQAVDSMGKARVRCDVDLPGVMTIAPLHRLRRLISTTTAGRHRAGTSDAVPIKTALRGTNTDSTGSDASAPAATLGTASALARSQAAPALPSPLPFAAPRTGTAAVAGATGTAQRQGATSAPPRSLHHRRARSAM